MIGERVTDVAKEPADVRRRSVLRGRGWRRLQPFFIPLAILGAWQLSVSVTDLPTYRLPRPLDVWDALWSGRLRWPSHIVTTVQETLGGFALAAIGGITLAIIIAWTPALRRLLLPSIVVFDTLPKVALAPLFIIYLGIGVFPNMMIAAVIAFFPILINTVTGLHQTDDDLIDLARSLRAPKWKVFLKIRLPYSVPYILSALRIASTLAVTGAVFGEFLASQRGLGNIVIQTQVSLQTHVAFAGLVYLAILGYGLYTAVTWMGRKVFPWAVRDPRET